MKGAGFQGTVKGGAASPVPGLFQGVDLRVRSSHLEMGTLSQDLAGAHDHRACKGIGADPAATSFRQAQGPAHVGLILPHFAYRISC